jgi:hypothetical protein
VATPFVQGHYREDLETVTIETECAHCSRLITIEFDRDLTYRVMQADADPQVFIPLVNFDKLDAPNIIDAF